jgi:hypothetical protein
MQRRENSVICCFTKFPSTTFCGNPLPPPPPPAFLPCCHLLPLSCSAPPPSLRPHERAALPRCRSFPCRPCSPLPDVLAGTPSPRSPLLLHLQPTFSVTEARTSGLVLIHQGHHLLPTSGAAGHGVARRYDGHGGLWLAAGHQIRRGPPASPHCSAPPEPDSRSRRWLPPPPLPL